MAVKRPGIRYHRREKGHKITTIPEMDGYVSTGMVEYDLHGYWYEFRKGRDVRWIIGEKPKGIGREDRK